MNQSIGIVGGGQLGRMLTYEAQKLGFFVTILDPTPGSPAGQVADRQIVADFKDADAIRSLASQVDFLTFEIELANAGILEELATAGVTVNPSATTLSIIQDKLRQKQFLRDHGVPVPPFFAIKTRRDIEAAARQYGYPLLIKARFDGYDGRGNAILRSDEGINVVLARLASRELYGEAFIRFEKELAVVVARSEAGDIRNYPVVETVHHHNICHTVFAPAPISKVVREEAEAIGRKVMESLSGAGVFAIELFLTGDGQVLVNEIAPRVHNSGHFSIEACHASQFEQHIRAVTGMPLADPTMKVPAAVMVNILGDSQHPAQVDGLTAARSLPDVSVHIYGKLETKPERKMGHITAVAGDLDTAYARAMEARQLIRI